MPPASSIYACRDIQEIQWEKMVAYARALQHLAEKVDLPAGGKLHLLAKECEGTEGRVEVLPLLL